MSTMISIDWDFFIPHGMYEREIYLPAVKDTLHGSLVFDWQMSESRSADFERALWEIRAANFKTWGLDIEEMTRPPLSNQDFMTELSIKLNDAVVPAWKADSHAWGSIIARDYAKVYGPLSVVNFDAHHDLGYRNTGLPVLDAENGNVHCDDWAWMALEKGWISDYTVVYPDWLGKVEWEGVKRPWLKRFSKRVHIQTWSEWVMTSTELDDPEVGFICRSSSWTPPWLDGEFENLCDEWGYVECLDCNMGTANTDYNVCEKREWDWADVDSQIEARNAMIKRLEEIQNQA